MIEWLVSHSHTHWRTNKQQGSAVRGILVPLANKALAKLQSSRWSELAHFVCNTIWPPPPTLIGFQGSQVGAPRSQLNGSATLAASGVNIAQYEPLAEHNIRTLASQLLAPPSRCLTVCPLSLFGRCARFFSFFFLFARRFSLQLIANKGSSAAAAGFSKVR